MKAKLSIYGFLALLLGLAFYHACQSPEASMSKSPFLSVADSAIGYVGMQTCRSCHADVYEEYQHTGMGLSFERASRSKSKASFGPEALVYDSLNNYYYKPFFAGDSLYVLEFRLDEFGDTIHRRLECIDYIIGSGHHTNSHLIERNGYLYQAPITYYTQEGKWDLAPGFEDGNNKRFSRWIGHECLTCHNHLPEPVAGSENKYQHIPEGIECERCHGPGERHVRERLTGSVVDTSLGPDYSIVNPRRLPIELQTDLCQRCHLQGIAILEPSKSFYDFKPGMPLHEVMKVFLPRFSNSDKRFIMASQADRLQQSACYTQSKELSCISCHHPHYSVKDTVNNRYTRACQSCHQKGSAKSKLFDCSESQIEREKVGDLCVHCHMPKSGSIDIPHVHITDHYISKKNTKYRKELEPNEKESIASFLGLEALNRGEISARDKARGFLALYDKFMPDALALDSAKYYLEAWGKMDKLAKQSWIHYQFSRRNYSAVLELAKGQEAEQERDAWTAYRIGESYNRLEQGLEAQAWLEAAVAALPYHLDFREKLAAVYAKNGLKQKAKQTFEWILKEDAGRSLAWGNYGLLLAQMGRYQDAEDAYRKCLALEPDNVSSLINYTLLCLEQGRKGEAKGLLLRAKKIAPQEPRLHLLAKELQL